jgi:hypothetical protein
MSQPRLKQASRAYSGLVIATTIFSAAILGWDYFPGAAVRGHGLVLGRAGEISLLSALLSSIVGGTMSAACLLFKVEPPVLLVRRTLMAILVFLLDLMLLPAINEA